MSRVMLLLSIILMDLLVGVEFDLFVPSFPELQNRFSLAPFWVEALLSANFLGFAFSLFFVGSLADRYGRRPMIIAGLTTFILGSLLCILDHSYSTILAGRFLQGIGIAAPAILSFLLIADTYPMHKQQFFFAMLNGIMNASVAIAPVVGSYITLHYHWQGNFFALFILGIITLMMALFFIPNTSSPQTKDPISYRSILQSKPVMMLTMTLILIFLPYWIFVGIAPILYMQDLGVSLSHFGYYQGILAMAFALGSIFYGLILTRTSSQKMLLASNGLFIISAVFICLLSLQESKDPVMITFALLLFVIGQIVPSSVVYPICLNRMPAAKGRVAAIIQAGRLLFSSLALQLAGLMYTGSLYNVGLILTTAIFLAICSLTYSAHHVIEKKVDC